MSDLRFDPIFQQWTAIAEIRRERPQEFLPVEQIRKQIICPFCKGNEDETPLPVALWDRWANLIPLAEDRSWSARVIPNKYPTYDVSRSEVKLDSGPSRTSGALGQQELIIPTPRHVCSLSELERDELVVALIAAQQRIGAWRQNADLRHAMLFKNCRHEAGSSIEHTHFQLLGSPVTSDFLRQRAERFKASLAERQHSPLEEIVEFETRQELRLVCQGKDFIAFCPFASRMAFQIWIVPRNRTVSFADCPRPGIEELARLSRGLVGALEDLLGRPAYNWILHQLPYEWSEIDHWFIEIVPRVSKIAGYEMGTDIWVNSVAPETAAKRLRLAVSWSK